MASEASSRASLGGSPATAFSKSFCNSSCSACSSEAFLSSLPASSTSSLRSTCSSRIRFNSSSTSSFEASSSSSDERTFSISLSASMALSWCFTAAIESSCSIVAKALRKDVSGFLSCNTSEAPLKRRASDSSVAFSAAPSSNRANCSNSRRVSL